MDFRVPGYRDDCSETATLADQTGEDQQGGRGVKYPQSSTVGEQVASTYSNNPQEMLCLAKCGHRRWGHSPNFDYCNCPSVGNSRLNIAEH